MVISRRYFTVFACLLYFFIVFYVALYGSQTTNANVIYAFISFFTVLICFFLSKWSGVRIFSVLNLFLLAYSFFIFGRCFYIVLLIFFHDVSFEVENLYSLFWMAKHTLDIDASFLMFKVTNGFVVSFVCGYLFVATKEPKFEAFMHPKPKYKVLMLFLLMVTAPIYLSELFFLLNKTLSSGYLAKFSNQGEVGSSNSIVKHVFYVSVISLLILSDHKYKYYFLLILIPFLSVLTGGRGGFVYPLLTLFYLFLRLNPDFKISFVKASLFLLLVFTVMSISIQFSARGQTSTDNFYDFFYFLNSQGVTLGVVSFSLFSDLVYEWHTLLQSFVPGFARIYSTLNPETPGYMGSITTFISYHANPEMFLRGNGLGSSVVSELYLLVFEIYPLFLLAAFVFGAIISFVEVRSYRSFYFFVFLIVILPLVINSPRNGFNVLFVSSVYVAVFVFLFSLMSRIKLRALHECNTCNH